MTDGEVRKVDLEGGKLTLKHADIKSLDMPAMTMVFVVKDKAMLDKLKAGDKIKFKAINDAGKYTVTEMQMRRVGRGGPPAMDRTLALDPTRSTTPTSPRLEAMNIKNFRTCMALAAATLCGGALAASHIVDIAWAPDGRFTHQAQIAAGKFVEVCGKLSAGKGVALELHDRSAGGLQHPLPRWQGGRVPGQASADRSWPRHAERHRGAGLLLDVDEQGQCSGELVVDLAR